MSRDLIPLYGGQINANRIGTFTRAGVAFDIIRPGYDSQGRRRIAWTQFVYQGVPVYEVKLRADTTEAMKRFDQEWRRAIEGENAWKLIPALEACIKDRRAKFRDGVTGETPAPALAVDGRGDGKRYPA